MLNLSYTLTPKLKVNCENIDRVRLKILTISMPREKEFRLSWQAKLARTYASLSMSGNELEKIDMSKLLSKTETRESLTKYEKEVVNYTKAQDYINQHWYVSDKRPTYKDVYKLYKLATGDVSKKASKNYKREIKQFIDYIEKGTDHPAIKAGVAQIELRLVSPFSNNNGRITRLLSQLFIYKYGYDMRGFLALDEQWKLNLARFRQETDVAALDKSITGWLEFYTDCLVEASQKALNLAREDRKVLGVEKSFWKISNRQREILSLLENPDIHITNRDVQVRFKVSQITASRDLSSLTKQGFLFSHGDGRSTYYTRV